ncbi:MAG: hypothetical protein CVU38_05905 [Chloroflexi bacterium HGW-Chloroflexi-1]|nr:MAG: hypothetical protein CVU38_05905 [Chloroflexi bacterium HGW-Chloroflexi-1]
MTPTVVLLIVGLLYIVVFGGLSLLRREDLSFRFAVEAGILTLVVTLLALATPWQIHPVLFLIVLYLVTLRVRLLVDIGNLLARRGNHRAAAATYRLARRLWPDDAGRLIVQINQGVLGLQAGRLDEAIAALKGVLAAAKGGYLGIRHECGCHYNLAVAYQRKGLDAPAALEFNAVLDTWPASEYAQRAEAALARREKTITSKE